MHLLRSSTLCTFRSSGTDCWRTRRCHSTCDHCHSIRRGMYSYAVQVLDVYRRRKADRSRPPLCHIDRAHSHKTRRPSHVDSSHSQRATNWLLHIGTSTNSLLGNRCRHSDMGCSSTRPHRFHSFLSPLHQMLTATTRTDLCKLARLECSCIHHSCSRPHTSMSRHALESMHWQS